MGGVVSASQPVAMPTTAAQAALALRMLSSDYFASAGNSAEQAAVHAEAQRIRSLFPGSGPAGGYTQAQLSSASTWQQAGLSSTAAQYAATAQQAAYTPRASTAVSAALPVAMPTSWASAQAALRTLSGDWLNASDAAITGQISAAKASALEAAAHAEAQTIRSRFPGAGPNGGYTAAALAAATKKASSSSASSSSAVGFVGSIASGLAENVTRFMGSGGSTDAAAAAVPYAEAAGAAAAEATGIVAASGAAAYGIGQIPGVQHAGAVASSAVNRVASALTGSGGAAASTPYGIPKATERLAASLPSYVTSSRTAGNITVDTTAAATQASRAVSSAASGSSRSSSPVTAPGTTYVGPTSAAVSQAKKKQQQPTENTSGNTGNTGGGGSGFLSSAGSAIGRVLGTGAAIGGGAALIGGTPQGQALIGSVGKDVGKAVGSAAHGIARGAAGWPWWLWVLLVGGGVVAAHELGG